MWNQICNTVNAMYTNPIPLKSIGFTFMVPTIFGAAMRFCGSATIRVCYGQNTIKHTGHFHIFHTLENYVHTIMTITELGVKWVVNHESWLTSHLTADTQHVILDESFKQSVVLVMTTELIITKTTMTIFLRPFVWDYPGEPVPEETFIGPPSWSSSNLYQLLPPSTIYSILPVQIMCLEIFLHNLSPHPLWSICWSGASTSYSICLFTQSMSSFCNTWPYHCNLFCCSINIISSIPSLWTP